jgi:thiamine transporter
MRFFDFHIERKSLQMKTMKNTTRMICEGAIMLAVALLLGFLKLWELPQGGSVTLSMMPIFLFAARWGLKNGLLCGFAFGVLQLILDGAYAWGWQSIVGDYLLAFTVLGFAGITAGRKYGVFTGTLIGAVARFLVHYVVGATVWAEYMPAEFFGLTMTTPWFYSMLYNGSYMLIDMLLCLVIFVLLWRPMGKYLRGEDLLKA